jgi:hypothetical protein
MHGVTMYYLGSLERPNHIVCEYCFDECENGRCVQGE